MEGTSCSKVEVVELGMRADEEFAIRGLLKPAALLVCYTSIRISGWNIPAEFC